MGHFNTLINDFLFFYWTTAWHEATAPLNAECDSHIFLKAPYFISFGVEQITHRFETSSVVGKKLLSRSL